MTTTNTTQLSDEAKAALDAILDKYKDSTPAVAFGATSKDGVFYEGYRGDRTYGKPEDGQINKTTTYQIYSMTKFVTSLAVLQQVEAGLLSYDDPEIVRKYAPELCAQKILVSYDKETKKAEFADLKRTPTLRDLMTHTSGQVYDFVDPSLSAYDADNDLVCLLGDGTEKYVHPFLFSPGERFMYGIGVDWAGIILERATGKNLEEYFREHIFDPLGVSKDTTFKNRPDIVERWQHSVCRNADGSLKLVDPRHPLNEDMAGQLSGGGGLWSTLDDYLALLRGVLRAQQPGGIIKPESFELIFKDFLPPEAPEGGCRATLAFFLALLGMTDPGVTTPETVGHSIACMVNTNDTGTRKAGSGSWGGASLTQFVIDPASGVALVVMTQIEHAGIVGAKPAPEPFIGCWRELEEELYKHLS